MFNATLIVIGGFIRELGRCTAVNASGRQVLAPGRFRLGAPRTLSAVAEGAATEGAEWIGEYREAAVRALSVA
jgi:hypothetical protein